MRKPAFALVMLLPGCLSLTGCGGCGGLTEAELRRRSIPNTDVEPQTAAQATAGAAKNADNNQDASQVVAPATGPVAAGAPAAASTPVSNAKPAGPLTETERRARSIANLEKISQALTAYAKKHGHLPTAGVPVDGTLTHSWRVTILPELGYPELYKRFTLGQPWDYPKNKLLLDYIPPEYQSPERFDVKTNYLGVKGQGMALSTDYLEHLSSGVPLATIKDGPDNTLVVVEVDDKYAQEWTRPTEYLAQLELPSDKLGSLRGEGAFGILASGRVVLLPRELPPSRLAALFTIAGGEPIGSATFLPPPTAEPPPPMLAALPDDPSLANQPPPESAAEPANAEAAVAQSEPEGTEAGLLGGGAFAPDPAKEPVPREESLAKARELLEELFGDDYRQARTRQGQQEFLNQLLDEAANVDQNPADFYELVRIVRDGAAALGDVPQALAACALLEQRFQVDPLAMRLLVLETASKHLKGTRSLGPALDEARRVYGDAVARDRYEIALPAHELIFSFARIEGDKAWLTRLQREADALASAKSLHAAAQRGLTALKDDPNDAAANEAVGVYVCLVKGRWDAGLHYLARADDIRLRGIASLEMAAGRSLEETLSLAQQHWDLAARFKQPQRRGLHLRAVYCYGLVLPKLATGLESLKAQRRIDEAAGLYGLEEIDRISGRQRPMEARSASEDKPSPLPR